MFAAQVQVLHGRLGWQRLQQAKKMPQGLIQAAISSAMPLEPRQATPAKGEYLSPGQEKTFYWNGLSQVKAQVRL